MLAVEARADESDEGPALRFMQSRPEVPDCVSDLYYWSQFCDRDGMSGALTFRGVVDVADHLRLIGSERDEFIVLCFEMDSARRKKHDDLKPEKSDG